MKSQIADVPLKFDALAGPGDLLVVCGTITPTFGFGFGLFVDLPST